MQTIPMTMQIIMHAAQAAHASSALQNRLAFPCGSDVPPAFNRLAHTDFAVLSEADESLDWDDYCPAYALGLLTFEGYCREASPVQESTLEEQWGELRGSSRLAWEQARMIIARSWNAMTRIEREGCHAGAW